MKYMSLGCAMVTQRSESLLYIDTPYYHKDEDDRDLDDNNKELALCESRMKRPIK